MAYHLGRILRQDFGHEAIAVMVRGEAANHGIFDYDPVFPSISIADMEASITDEDVLIANPSFSRFFFGLKCRGCKVMYVQGFTTYGLLDCGFDLYVSVSEGIRRFLSATWAIETKVIPPFIQPETFPPAPPWRDRPPRSILVLVKDADDHNAFLLERLRHLIGQRHPDVSLDPIGEKMPQRELLERMGQYRHFLTLSVAEGFGLMPLEAMAMGATVLGFETLGSRDYMRPGLNCAVTSYPDIEGVAERIIDVMDHPDKAETLAAAGRRSATDPLYSIERFYDDWRKQFTALLHERSQL
jgi:hypothetical protein